MARPQLETLEHPCQAEERANDNAWQARHGRDDQEDRAAAERCGCRFTARGHYHIVLIRMGDCLRCDECAASKTQSPDQRWTSSCTAQFS